MLVFNFDETKFSTFSFMDFTTFPMLYLVKSIKYLNDIDLEDEFQDFYNLIHGKF